MMFQYSPHVTPLTVATVLAIVVAYLSSQKRPDPGAGTYSASMIAIGIWSVGQVFLVAGVQGWIKTLGVAITFLGATSLPTFWLLFGITYTGNGSWLTPRRLAMLVPVPLIYAVLILTNSYHELIVVDPQLETVGQKVLLDYDWGPLIWPLVGYSYTLVAVGTALLGLKFLRTRNVYRKSTFLLITGVVVMWMGNLVNMAGLSPFGNSYLLMTPYTFIVFGLLAFMGYTSVRFVQMIPLERTLAVMTSRIGDIVPLARDFVVEEMESGVVVLDTTDRIVDINSTAKDILGIRNRVVGKKVDDALELGVELDRTQMTERTWIDVLDSRKGGLTKREKCFEISVSPIERANGELAGRVVLIQDVTEQVRQQEELERKNERLDDFASLVSHDLRNPLNVASGYVDIARDNPDGEALDEIEHSLHRMEKIIDDVLTLARDGEEVDEKNQVFLGEIAREAWRNVDTHEAELETDAEVSIMCDRHRLMQVFENLFRNSVEHGGRDVTIRLISTEEGFYVEDTGMGIPDNRRDVVLEDGYTTGEDGTGLGLSIVNEIVEAHDWNMEVGESPEGGARFEIQNVDIAESKDIPDSEGAPTHSKEN